MVYECVLNGWMSEKECKNCFQKHKRKEYVTVKDCREENVKSEESNDDRDEE